MMAQVRPSSLAFSRPSTQSWRTRLRERPRYSAAHTQGLDFLALCQPPTLRTICQFTEQEIVVPNGPKQGRFRIDTQPYVGLLYAEIDSGNYNRYCITGPTQSGKTLCAFSAIILYYLFECQETVIVVVPMLEMGADKWEEDIRPVLVKTRYAALLPTKGPGSRGGGKLTSVRFKNGVTLRFMTGGGGDKSVAGYTARIVVITETDGMDTAGEKSRETDRIGQVEARTLAFGDRKQIFMECTLSTPEGRTWQEYTAGTASKIMVACPGCGGLVCPCREDLHGWQDAADATAAGDASEFACPDCGACWTDRQRIAMNRHAQLMHRGQEVVDGKITGDPEPTKTLGFRWGAFNNLFTDAAQLGVGEFEAAHAEDEENAEKKRRQFIWALTYSPPVWNEQNITPAIVMSRAAEGRQRGVVPADTQQLTIGFDVGKHKCWYMIAAFQPDRTIHLVDYGDIRLPDEMKGLHETQSVAYLLGQFRQLEEQGWAVEGSGDRRRPDAVWFDSKYLPDVVFGWLGQLRKTHPHYMACQGFGRSGHRLSAYPDRLELNKTIVQIGDGWHIRRVPKHRAFRANINADHYKLTAQACFATTPGQPGSVSIFHDPTNRNQHKELGKQICAEQLKNIDKTPQGKGIVQEWSKTYRHNHLLDCLAYAMAAANMRGFRLAETDAPKPQTIKRQPRQPLLTPHGQPYLITERG